MILDIGATKYMSGLLSLFITLTNVKNCYVTLGDDTVKLHVIDKGAIHVCIYSHVVGLQRLFFIPDLDDTLFSVTEHIKVTNCSLKTEKSSCILHYPIFSIKPKLDNEVYMNITLCSDLKILPDFTIDQTTMVNQQYKTLRTIDKDGSTLQISVIIVLITMHIFNTIHQYSSHQILLNRRYLSQI